MADFNVELSEVQGAGVQLSNPSTAKAQAIEQVSRQAIGLFEDKTKKEMELAQAQFESGVISDFMNKQLSIANAVNTGQMSPLKARMALRSNAQQAITTNPMLAEDVIKMHSKLMSTSGLAKSAGEAAEAIDQNIKEATSRGWIKPNMTQEQKHLALETYAAFKQQGDLLSRQQAQVSLENSMLETKSKTLGINRSEIELNRLRGQEGSKRMLDQLSNAYVPKFRSDMNSVIDQLANGQIDEKSAILAINEHFQSVQMITNQVGVQAGREYLTTVMAPMLQMRNDALALAKGEIDKDVYERKVQSMIAASQLNALRSSEPFRNYVAVSRLMPNVPPEFIVNATMVTQDLWSKMGKKEGQNGNVFDEDKAGVNSYFDGLKGSMKNAPKGDKEAQEEIQTHIDNVLRSIPQYSNTADRMADYLPVVDFLASPDTGRYIKEKGGIPSEFAEGAKDVLDFTYQQRVLPLIQEEFSKHNLKWELPLGKEAPERPDVKTSLGTGVLPKLVIKEPSVSVIEPLFSGSGVRFQVVPGIGESDEAARNRALQLNNLVSPMINKFIRMGAHLEGHTNYRQVFEQNFNSLFAPEPSEE